MQGTDRGKLGAFFLRYYDFCLQGKGLILLNKKQKQLTKLKTRGKKRDKWKKLDTLSHNMI